MLQTIALLAPSLIAVGFYNHLYGNKLAVRDLVIVYGVFLVSINLSVYLLYLYLFTAKEVLFENKDFIHYLLVASFFALLLPLVVKAVVTSISVDIQKNEKD